MFIGIVYGLCTDTIANVYGTKSNHLHSFSEVHCNLEDIKVYSVLWAPSSSSLKNCMLTEELLCKLQCKYVDKYDDINCDAILGTSGVTLGYPGIKQKKEAPFISIQNISLPSA